MKRASAKEEAGLHLLLRHAGRGGDDQGRRRCAISDRPMPTRSPHIANGRAGGATLTPNPGISVKLSALHPALRGGQDRSASWPNWFRRLTQTWRSAGRRGRHRVSTSTPRRPTGSRLSLDGDRTRAGRPGPGGLGRLRRRRPGLRPKRAGDVIDWLATTWPSAYDRRLMVRLVKGAYWDTEIKRAQVEGLDADFPVFTRKAATDVSYLANAPQDFAGHDRPPLPAVRDPQRPYRGRRPRNGRRPGQAPRSSSSACTAWARRCTTLCTS